MPARNSRDGRSLVTDLVLAVSLALVAGGAVTVSLDRAVVADSLRDELRADAHRFCSVLAAALAEDLWKLDDRAIRDYIAAYPQPAELASICVRTEFRDVVFGRDFRPGVNTVVFEQTVLRDGRPIGFVQVAFSDAHVRAVESALLRSGVLSVLLGITAVFLVVILFAHVVLGRSLRRLRRGIGRIAAGNYETPLVPTSYRELNALVGQVNDMARQIRARDGELRREIDERRRAQADLQALKDGLEEQVRQRTEALAAANRELEQEVGERRRAQEEILTVSGSEQQRIGQDLHDTLGQQLAGSAYLCGSLAQMLKAGPPPALQTAHKLGEILREAVAQTRRLARGLSPVAMVDDGLNVAIEQLADDTRAIFGIACEAVTERALVPDNRAATHLYRIVLEAVHNARRHGKATEIRIRLLKDGDGRGRLEVADNGRGFPAGAASREGMGLRTMRYRAEALAGELSLLRNEAGGTTVRVVFAAPVRAAAVRDNSIVLADR